MAQNHSVVGRSCPRVDGPAQVTGRAKYTADLILPRMLWGKILRSPHPHARIQKIDVSRAAKLKGVKAIVTGLDGIGEKCGALTIPPHLRDKYPLAVDRVRYIGDEVAAVAAEDEETAEEALDLIQVDYEILPTVFDPLEAMRPEAPTIHEKGNISVEVHYEYGSVEQGFLAAEHIREDRFETTTLTHGALEPQVCLANYEPSLGKLTVTTATQCPQNVAADLALTLGLPASKVRVNKPHVGGAFGGKIEMFIIDYCASLLSIKSGRPVMVVSSREEVFLSLAGRHPFIIDLKTGVKKDGTITAAHFQAILDNGAYNRHGIVVVYGGPKLLIPYRVPNFKYDGYLVYTNTVPGTSHQGVGSPQRLFALESQLDMIAEDLGLDPAELRMKNAREPGDVAVNEYHITSCGFKESIGTATKSSGWKEKRSNLPPGRGIGLGCLGDIAGGIAIDPFKKTSGAFVRINPDGSAILFTGASDVGQGSVTLLSQIVAEELGIKVAEVSAVAGDTELTPPHPGNYWETFLAGNAVKAAAADAKRQLAEFAAERLEANPGDLVFQNGTIYVAGSPDRSIPFREATAACFSTKGLPLLGRGTYSLKIGLVDRQTGKGDYSAAYTFGTRIAEVEVDKETGKVKVTRVTAAHDCGFAINPMAVEGQIEGGTMMALGGALTEQVIRQDGAVLNPSFLDYPLPTALEAPTVETILVESMDPNGPYGAKEAGQSLQVGIAGAIANAIWAAVGVRVKSLPLTPEKIVQALETPQNR